MKTKKNRWLPISVLIFFMAIAVWVFNDIKKGPLIEQVVVPQETNITTTADSQSSTLSLTDRFLTSFVSFSSEVIPLGPGGTVESQPNFQPAERVDIDAVKEETATLFGPYVTESLYPVTRHMSDVPSTFALHDEPGIGRGARQRGPKEDALTEEPSVEGEQILAIPNPVEISGLTVPIVNFEGLDYVGWGTGWPSDVNGDVGPNHYIQSVNTSMGIYDKSGTLLKAMTLNDFFDGTNTACDGYSKGDPIILYDSLADRWLISQMSWTFNNGPYFQCFALSASGDPMGDWYQWGFPVSYARWNDYAKIGVWDDGYYMTANMFQYYISGELHTGVWAFDRTTMLGGGPLREVHFELVDYTATNYYSSLLPVNYRGPLPPKDAPAYFVNVKANSTNGPLKFWELDVDWDDPQSATFVGTGTLSTNFFGTVLSCWGGGRECIPQLGTGQGLHSIHNKLMMQLQYRNFGTHESLWANHTIDADTSRDLAGVRWYEIRDPGGSKSIYQQGNQGGFAGDTVERWMGSLAVDGQGNMALGYSASNSAMYPEIRYTGRLVTDPLGTLLTETTMHAGTGSQDTTYRWGDYTSMTIDPVDDCTFWYTNQYYDVIDPYLSDWQTRVASFRFTECDSHSLSGLVYDSVSLAPIPEARVTAVQVAPILTYARTTDINGNYQTPVQAGGFNVTAQAYGYQPNTVPAVVSGDTTVDIPLSPASFYTVTGFITDAYTGYPLAARIFVLGEPVSPPALANQTWSDATTGFYSFVLPQHITYTFMVDSVGYMMQRRVIGQLTADTTEDFALVPDLVNCNAPGYDYVGLKEDFEVWPPPAWSIADFVVGNSLVWDHNMAYLDGNYTGGIGHAATVNSDFSGSTPYKTALRSPVLDMTAIPTTTLRYRVNYQDGSCPADGDRLDLSISTNGLAGPYTLLSQFDDCNLDDQGTMYNTPGAPDVINLSAYSAETDVVLSWYYHTDRTPPNWYAQIDEIRLGSCQAFPDAVRLEAEPMLQTGCCSGITQTEKLSFINHSGLADTVDITYATSPSVTVTNIPASLALMLDGSINQFDVSFMIDGSAPPSTTHFVTVTASLNGTPAYVDTAVIQKRTSTGTWEPLANNYKPRSSQAVIATDNYLYQIAGTASSTTETPSNYVYRYDPLVNEWATMSLVITPVHRIDGAAISNTIYILGGLAYDTVGSFEYSSLAVQIYNEGSNSWTAGADAPFSRSAYAAAAVGTDIYRIGGQSLISGPQANVDLYNTATDMWNDPINPGDYLWSVLWPCAGEIGGKIYVAGGQGVVASRNTAVYDPLSNSWNDGAMAELPVTLWGAADFVKDGRLYCAGGVQDDEVSAAVYSYDPVTDSWLREADLSEARYRMEGDTLMGDGYVENGWEVTFSYSSSTLERTVSCVVPCAAPIIPVTVVTITQTATDVILDWLATADATSYEVWYTTNDAPYFTPTGTCSAPGAGLGCAAVVGTNWSHVGVYGVPATNYFYKVFGATVCGMGADPLQHVGEFDFVIVPGS